MTDRARVAAEFRADPRYGPVADWLAWADEPRLWDQVARALALATGRRLLLNEGEGGWNPAFRQALARSPSPAVSGVAALLPVADPPRRWHATDVAQPALNWFGVYTGAEELKRLIRRTTFARPGRDAPVPA